MKVIRIVASGILVASFLLFFGQSSQAQSSIGIKISPVIIEEVVNPGDVIEKKITVTNESPEARTLFLGIRDFKGDGEGGQAKLIAPGSEQGSFLASWIEADNGGVDFGVNEAKEVFFRIKVPENAGPGGYYGAIVMGSEPPKLKFGEEERGAGMSIAQQAAALILLQVRGDVIEDVNIREFNTDKEFYGTPFSVNFYARLENKGNVHLKPVGTIDIFNMNNTKVQSIKFNPQGSNILPKSIRRFEGLKWEGGTAFGRYKAVLGLSYGLDSKLGGAGKQSLVVERYFWIIPWRIILPVVLGTLFLVLLAYFSLKFYKNRVIKKAMEQAGVVEVPAPVPGQATPPIVAVGEPSPTKHLVLIISVVLVVVMIFAAMLFFVFFA